MSTLEKGPRFNTGPTLTVTERSAGGDTGEEDLSIDHERRPPQLISGRAKAWAPRAAGRLRFIDRKDLAPGEISALRHAPFFDSRNREGHRQDFLIIDISWAEEHESSEDLCELQYLRSKSRERVS
jgi:hypothetical protein